jgi:hypothetical protein
MEARPVGAVLGRADGRGQSNGAFDGCVRAPKTQLDC